MNYLRRWQILILASVLGLALLPGLVSQTEAQWIDSEYVSGAVGSGSWVTSGYGRGSVALLVSAGGISVLPTGPNSLPWRGSNSERDAILPGTTTSPGTGPYSSNTAVATVNSLAMSGITAGTVVGASTCGSFSRTLPPGSSCAGSTVHASASASLSSLRLTGTFADVGGLIGILNTPIITFAPATSASYLTASVSCDRALGTNAAVAPKAGSAGSGNGVITVGGTSVSIPAANGTTTVPDFNTGLLNLIRYSGFKLVSTVSTPGSPVPNPTGISKLTLSGSISLIGLGVAPLSFEIDLVNAQCGPGTAPAVTTSTTALARSAQVPPTSSTATTEVPSNTETTTTAESASTTESETTTPSATETTTEEAAAAPPPEVTTTTEPPPVEAAEPPPVETAEPPPTPTTTTPPPTTTEPPDPATVFTGPAEGNVETLTFAGDVVCTAPTGADYTGTVELACDDGSSVAAIGSALTPAGVAASTAGGVWSPVLTAGGTARPVLAATRG